MVAVVTGGAGHLGTNLVAALRADGHDVRVVDLREPTTALRYGADWIRADVRDGARMRQAFEGATVVYHLAGVISVAGPMGGLVESVNVDGARVVAQAALAVGVTRLVHCSSVHAYSLAAAGQVIDESSPRSTGGLLPAYDRSKAGGEFEVFRVVDRGLDAVIVNPTGVIGPRDEAPSRMGTVLLALWRRRLPAVVAGGFDWVDVRDIATAMRAAAQHGRTGENYLLPGHRLTMSDLAGLARTCSTVAVTRRTAPDWAVSLCAPLATVIAARTRNPLLPTYESLRALRRFPIVDGTKAARDLGHQPRPLEETLTDLYTFFTEKAGARPPSLTGEQIHERRSPMSVNVPNPATLDPKEFAQLVKKTPADDLKQLMQSDRRTALLDEIFARIVTLFRSDRAGSTNAVIHWIVSERPDGGADTYELVIADGTCQLSPKPEHEPKLAVTLGSVDLLKVATGNANAIALFMTGKLKAKGDLGLAANIPNLFDIPKG